MPFIKLKTNVEIKDKERLKTLFGKVITAIPGKEEWMTMISFEEKVDLYLAGSGEPCAMVDTLVNEGTNHSKNIEYGDAVIDLISAELGIPRNRIYVIVQEQDFWYAEKA